MNKQFFYALLCGAMILFTGTTFTSCNNNDDEIEELKSRMTALEVAIYDIVENALVTGASVTSAVQDANGAWEITLSNGQTINIGASGSSIQVTITDTEAIFTIAGDVYKLPLGAAVSSLIYSPEYVDGIVQLGNEGAKVKFLARPALTNIDGATFTIAESHELKTRAADGDQFAVAGAAIVGEFIEVDVIGIFAEAGKTYTASVQMELRGTVIGSNYFTIKVADNFSFEAEALDASITLKSAYAPAAAADGAMEMTINGTALTALTNFKDLFESLPENAEFIVAPNAAQPGGKAQEKHSILSRSLKKDGTWAFAERPGTSFNDNAERKGFLVYVRNKAFQIIAKVYVMINDELANVDLTSNLTNLEQHMEYGTPAEGGVGVGEGQGIVVEPGANEINLTSVLMQGQLSLCHGSTLAFLESFKNMSAQLNNEDFIYNDGSRIIADQATAQPYIKHSMGVKWVNKHSSIGKSQRRNWVDTEGNSMSDDAKRAIAGSDCNGELYPSWDPTSTEDLAAKGIQIAGNGFLNTTAAYGGWCLRLGVGLEFEYDYGSKPLHSGCLIFLWINRRVAAMNVVDVGDR